MKENKNMGGELNEVMGIVVGGTSEMKTMLIDSMKTLAQHYGMSQGNMSAILLNKPIKLRERTIDAVGTNGKVLLLIDIDGEVAASANEVRDVHLLIDVFEEVLTMVRKKEIGRMVEIGFKRMLSIYVLYQVPIRLRLHFSFLIFIL